MSVWQQTQWPHVNQRQQAWVIIHGSLLLCMHSLTLSQVEAFQSSSWYLNLQRGQIAMVTLWYGQRLLLIINVNDSSLILRVKLVSILQLHKGKSEVSFSEQTYWTVQIKMFKTAKIKRNLKCACLYHLWPNEVQI